jgi:hypothetical protein
MTRSVWSTTHRRICLPSLQRRSHNRPQPRLWRLNSHHQWVRRFYENGEDCRHRRRIVDTSPRAGQRAAPEHLPLENLATPVVVN